MQGNIDGRIRVRDDLGDLLVGLNGENFDVDRFFEVEAQGNTPTLATTSGFLNGKVIVRGELDDVVLGNGSRDSSKLSARTIDQVFSQGDLDGLIMAEDVGSLTSLKCVHGIVHGIDINQIEQNCQHSEEHEHDDHDHGGDHHGGDDGWELGTPDLEFKMPEAFTVESTAQGHVYRYFVISNPLPNDIVVRAMDFRPGDPRVVHHMNSFVDYAGRGRRLEAEDATPGFEVFGTGGFMDYSETADDGGHPLGGWAPGANVYSLPDGYGIHIKAGGEIVIEIHYTPQAEDIVDQSTLALYFADSQVNKYLDGTVIGTQDLRIRAGDDDYQRRFYMNVPADLEITDLTPHMHFLGKHALVELTGPNGSTQTLIDQAWNFNQQPTLIFDQPILAKAGSRITATFSWDNSAHTSDDESDHHAHDHGNHGNHDNSEPIDVSWGWGSSDEMAEVWIGFVPVRQSDAARIKAAADRSWLRSADPDVSMEEISTNNAVQRLKATPIWSAEGQLLVKQVISASNVQQVIDRFRTLTNDNPNNDNYWVILGVLVGLTSDFDEQNGDRLATQADEAFDTALAIDEGNWDAWMSKADLYSRSHDRTIEGYAIQVLNGLIPYQETIRQQPWFVRSYILLGDLQSRHNHDDAAIQTWQRGLDNFNGNHELMDRLGMEHHEGH